MSNQFSSLCISLLTQLLDLNSLEGLLDDHREEFVLKNIKAELGTDGGVDVPLEDAIANDFDHPERKEKKLHKRLIKTSSKESNHVFGGKLTENSVKTMINIMEHLKNFTEVEGLFRISGNKRRQEDLKEMLNKGQSVDLSDRQFSQHDLTTILKQFFAELNEPLLTDSLYNCYKQVAGKTREMDGKVSVKKRLTALQLLSLMLPPVNRILFKKLIELLHLVSERTVNLMTSKNLAVVFAPNIVTKTKISCLTDVNTNLEPLTEIIEFIIENANQIFKVPDELFDQKQKTGMLALGTPKVFCRQLDMRGYQQETVNTTNDALAELLSQVMSMPDNNPMKKQFLDDFRKKYPGTPPFVPKRRRVNLDSPASQRTPALKRKPEEELSNLSEDFEKEDGMFLSTPEKRRLFTEGELAEHLTPTPRENAFDSESLSSASAHIFETIPEKRKRFRRPSFSRPSFGFFNKRSTPDLRKLPKESSQNSINSKRTRSSSATNSDESDPKRRFSFTPFLDRKFNQQRSLTEKRPPKRSNKINASAKIQRNMQFEKRRPEDVEMEHFPVRKELHENSRNTEQSQKAIRAKPELRAPLMNIRTAKKPLIPDSFNIRRETLALHKEQKVNIEAFRPRRETLAIQRTQPAILPLKPRRKNFDLEKGQPVLESFKPKRDSLLIHKKMRPHLEEMKSVQKEVYNDYEDSDNEKKEECKSKEQVFCIGKENFGFRQRDSFRAKNRINVADRDVDSPVKFTSFGKQNFDEKLEMTNLGRNEMHLRRMSTGSIFRSGWTQSKRLEDGCMVTYL